MKQLSVSLLGYFRVELDSEPVTDFATDKTRALLAFLTVEADRPHRRDALAGLLWPNFPQGKALQNLRKTLSRLRTALEDRSNAPPFLLIDSKTIRLNPKCDVELDVDRFKILNQTCLDHAHRSREHCLPCVRRMEQMVDLYQGDFLDQFFLSDSTAFEEWATTIREGLQRQAVDALRHLIEHHRRRGETRQALRRAWRQVDIQPWREDAHRQLMRLLAEDDQRGAALAQYAACRRIMAEELSIEPTAETTALYERIKAEGTVQSPSPRANLPPQVTPFTGREKELSDLAELIANPDCRLLTLVGPGGIGKTRLALQAASDHVGIFHHGVWFVPLVAVDAASLIATTIADALPLSLHGSEEPDRQLLNYLREKELLLVLDNMEHILQGSDLLCDILRHAPGIVIVVTSRERLRLREEWVYEVEGLAYPLHPAVQETERYSAIDLFTQTAQRIQHTFTLTEERRPWVARICTLVEGMPLAIELAAAWIPTRTCEEITEDIERNLDALSTTLRNVPQRHRTVRAAFDTSWDRLPREARIALPDLAVFRGGFQADAAERGLDIPTFTLTMLVEKSLLRQGDAGRYHLHELLRQYAMEKLHTTPQRRRAAANRHAAYFTGYLQKRETGLQGQRQDQALEEIAREIENVRAAWRWAIAVTDITALARAMGSLGTFYTIRSQNQEGSEAFQRAAEGLEPDPDHAQQDVVFGRILAWCGSFAYQLGRYEEAEGFVRDSLERLRRRDAQREMAFSLLTLAQLKCHARHDYGEAARLFQQSLDSYREDGDRYGMAQSLDGLGDVAARQGQHEQAGSHYEAALTLRREVGDLWGIATSLGSLGSLAGRMGEYDKAQRWFEESLAICRQIDNQRGIAACLHNLSTIAYLKADYGEAQRLRQKALEICREIGYRWGIASSLKSLGDVYRQLGDYEKAQQHLRRSLGILEEMGDRRAQAFTLNSLGTVAQTLGNEEESWHYFEEALEAAMEIQEPPIALDILSGMALLMASDGESASALELATFVHHHPASEQQTRDSLNALWSELGIEQPPAPETGAPARELGEVVAAVLNGEGAIPPSRHSPELQRGVRGSEA